MEPARQREIASKGGRAAHEKGTAHEWSSGEARDAGRKGGVTVSQDRAHMAAIGREGGESRSAAARMARQHTGDREVQCRSRVKACPMCVDQTCVRQTVRVQTPCVSTDQLRGVDLVEQPGPGRMS